MLSSSLQQIINKNVSDFKIARHILKNYHPFQEIEVEARIIRNDIDLEVFKKIQDFLNNNSNTTLVKETKSLDINVGLNERMNQSDNMSNLRFTLEDRAISEYCKTDKLPDEHTLLYKAPLLWYSDTTDINTPVNIEIDKNKYNADIHDIRLSARVELPYNKTSGQFERVSNIPMKILDDSLNKANTQLQNYKSTQFQNLYKTYRLKHRYRYLYKPESDADDIYIDMTRVRSSKKKMIGVDRSVMIPVLNFIDSEIVEQNEEYEIEFEIVKTGENTLANTIQDVLFKLINTEILPYAFNSPAKYVYTKNEEKMALSIYRVELNRVYKQIFQYKLDIISVVNTMLSDKLIDSLLGIKGLIDSSLLEQFNKQIDRIYQNYNLIFYLEYPELKNYSFITRLIDNLRIKILKKISKDKYDEFNGDFKDSPSKKANIIKIVSEQLSELKTEYDRKLKYGLFGKESKYMFISPKVMTMEMNNIRYENINSIQFNYSVTDKADGQGMILFNIENSLHLIDSNMRIYPTDIYLKDIKGFYVINGEYIGHTTPKKYGIFDSYFIDNNVTLYNPLMITEDHTDGLSRLSKAKGFLNEIENRDDFIIFLKEFVMASEDRTIWSAGKKIWERYNNDEGYSYHLDGLIYTPLYEPVGYINRDLDYDLKLSSTWKRNLKWKPAAENTIDSLLTFDKMIIAKYNNRELKADKEIELSVLDNGGQQIINSYKVANIRNGKVVKKSDRDGDSILEPYPFSPESPAQSNAHIIYLPLEWNSSTNKKQVMSTDVEGNKMVVEDNTIVELSYKNDMTIPYQHRWKILRTRYDKTFLYRRGLQEQKNIFELLQLCIRTKNPDEQIVSKVLKYIKLKDSKLLKTDPVRAFMSNIEHIQTTYTKPEQIPVDINYGNMASVANSIWTTIHNPITEENILEGKNIPEISLDDDRYYNNEEGESRSLSVTVTLQTFHNYIKSHILLENAVKFCRFNMNYVHLLDMTCGQGGDIFKWDQYKIDRCLGIDLYESNIKTGKESAINRYNNYINDFKSGERAGNPVIMDFLVGDASIRYKTDLNKAIPNAEYRSTYEKLMSSVYDKKPFNLISFMFSIHYFFKDIKSLDSVLHNINDHLTKGGLLIGSCFDGNAILNEFIQNLSDLNIYKNGRLIMKIVPEFLKKHLNDKWIDKAALPNSEQSLGLDIDVYIYSINKLIKEYLVNFEYLKKRLEEYDIYPLTETEMSSMLLPSVNNKKLSMGSFAYVYEFLGDIINNGSKLGVAKESLMIAKDILKHLSEEEYNISKLNSFFIFRKRGGVVKKTVEAAVPSVVTEDNELVLLRSEYDKMIKEINESSSNLYTMRDKIAELQKVVKAARQSSNKSVLKYYKTVIKAGLEEVINKFNKMLQESQNK